MPVEGAQGTRQNWTIGVMMVRREKAFENVRQRILNILKERGQATVADLATALDRAPVSLRHHLDILQKQELIRTAGVQRRNCRGRPRHIYVLTEAASRFFPHSYVTLADELLKEMKQRLPAEQVTA
ncbi:MAG: helix-turn-helix domain-containing protein, partial [Chloroflexi bacterium]|nr:helix-turn-helix domain-containing protein [Chloroflexota bacterium]